MGAVISNWAKDQFPKPTGQRKVHLVLVTDYEIESVAGKVKRTHEIFRRSKVKVKNMQGYCVQACRIQLIYNFTVLGRSFVRNGSGQGVALHATWL